MGATWLTTAEAAKTMGVSRSTISRRVRRGMLQTKTDKSGRRLVCVPVESNISLEPMAHAKRLAKKRQAEDQSKADQSGEQSQSTISVDAQQEIAQARKIAGASLVLAQRNSDEAYQHAAQAYNHAEAVRQQSRWAMIGLASTAGVCLLLCVIFGLNAASASARAVAQRDQVVFAQREIAALKQQVAMQDQRINALNSEVAQAQTQSQADANGVTTVEPIDPVLSFGQVQATDLP